MVHTLVLSAVLTASLVCFFLPFENVYRESWIDQSVFCERPCSYGSCLVGSGQVVVENMRPEHQLLYVEARPTPPQWWVNRWVNSEGGRADFADQVITTTAFGSNEAVPSSDHATMALLTDGAPVVERVACWPGVYMDENGWPEYGNGMPEASPGCEPITPVYPMSSYFKIHHVPD